MNTQFDIPEMHTVYREDLNYKIIDQDSNNRLCAIYFSSNGLYFPNTSEEFEEVILKNNRFEWEENIFSKARKVILLRDVTKQWYWNGINSQLNSVENLLNFLRTETSGMDIITIGSSAGGYAAVLFGHLLRAISIFTFSGQFSLKSILTDEHILENPSIAKLHLLPEYSQYLEIMNLLKNGEVPIFYFYPALCHEDIEQALFVQGFKNIYPFRLGNNIHGKTCYQINFLDLFSMKNQVLIALSSHYKDKLIKSLEFSVRVSGIFPSFRYLMRVIYKKIRNIIRTYAK